VIPQQLRADVVKLRFGEVPGAVRRGAERGLEFVQAVPLREVDRGILPPWRYKGPLPREARRRP
jgi:hypothetical protein